MTRNKRQKIKIPETGNIPVESKKSDYRIIYYIIFILAFILYANTISHDYALDDAIVITENEFTKKGFGGFKDILSTELFTGFFGKKKDLVVGGRYRPLSLITFAIEYELFGLNPHISHLINILLYAFTGSILFYVLSGLLNHFPSKKWYFSLPFWITIFYIAHPVHTEVVANIKGRDEIISLLGALLTFRFLLQYLNTQKIKFTIYGFFSFFLALLSKEIAITFVVTIPLAIYFFSEQRLKNILTVTVPLILSSILYLIIRHAVLGSPTVKIADELMNNPFLYASTAEKFATIFYTWGLYLKLLFFPHPLTYDYYPFHISIINWLDLRAIISLIIYLFLGLYALFGIKKKNIISFGILFYLISFSPVSNLFFPIGVFMNERFLFVASLGFTIIVAYLFLNKLPVIIKNHKRFNIILICSFLIILSLYSLKTVSRNTAWKDDLTLFTTDVKTSANSAKSNTSAGGKLIEEAIKPENADKRNDYLELSIQYLTRAVEIHPRYVDALLLLGNAYYEYNKDYDKTLYYYKRILKQNPDFDRVYDNIGVIFNNYENVNHKIKIYEELYTINPDRFEINYKLGNLYGKFKNDLQKSAKYLEKAIELNPNSKLAYKDLGVVYGLTGKYEQSARILERAHQLDPQNAQVLINLGITYQQSGNMEKAREYFNKAFEIDPSLKINNKILE